MTVNKNQVQEKLLAIADSSVDAEYALLGGMLWNRSSVYEIGDITAEDFSYEVFGKMFTAICNLLKRDIKHDSEVEKFFYECIKDYDCFNQGGEHEGQAAKSFIQNLKTDAIGVTSFAIYSEIIVDYSRRRKLFSKIVDILDKTPYQAFLEDGTLTGEKLISNITEACLLASARGQEKKFISFSDATLSVIDTALDSETEFTPTGIAPIDGVLYGGFYAGKTYSFAARPKQGKTTLLGSIHYNMCTAENNVAYFSLEMGHKEIHQRNVARMLGKNSKVFYKLKEKPEFRQSLEYTREMVSKKKDQPNAGYFIDCAGINFMELQRMFLTAVKVYGVKGIFFDYIGILNMSREDSKRFAGKRHEFEEEVAKWMAQFAKEHNIWIAYAAQLGRENNVRNGDGALMNADVLLFINKSEKPKHGYYTISLVMAATRYTDRVDVGTPDEPVLKIAKQGVHISELTEADKPDFVCMGELPNIEEFY
jgi:replicative DNA helicase